MCAVKVSKEMKIKMSSEVCRVKGYTVVVSGGNFELKDAGSRIPDPAVLVSCSPTKFLVPPTTLVRVRCRVRVHGSGLGFWNLAGRNKRFRGRIIGTLFLFTFVSLFVQ